MAEELKDRIVDAELRRAQLKMALVSETREPEIRHLIDEIIIITEGLIKLRTTILYAIRDKVSGEYCKFLGMGGTVSLYKTVGVFDTYPTLEEAQEILNKSKVYDGESSKPLDISKENLEIVQLNITATVVEGIKDGN